MDIRQAIAGKKAAHAALAEKAEALNAEVTTLRKDIVGISTDLRISEENLSGTDRRLKDLRQQKTVYLWTLRKDRQAMNDLVSAARKYSQTSTPLMLIQGKPVDAARASIIMKSMIPLIHRKSASLQERLSEIVKIEDDITEQLDLQTQQSRDLGTQQAELAAFLEERHKLYQRTEAERREQEKEVTALVRESRDLEELMKNIKSKNKEKEARTNAAHASAHASAHDSLHDSLPSNILLPVHGDIHTGFGDKNDLGAESKGITFLTRPGASVIVPLAGTVKFTGAFQNYQSILIVEHQGGYHSLIAGLARIDTVVGASLASGEPVGVAKDSSAPQIYYELRQNGKPVNPKKLLIAQRKQEKS